MTFEFPPEYWLEIPAGRYRVGLTPEEARSLAVQSAHYMNLKGPEFSLNDAKMLGRALSLQNTTGNTSWLEQYLLARHPAREIDLPAFAIAKQPITNRVFRQFMADTGETQAPDSWDRSRGNDADNLPACGLSWWQAVAIAEWAGCRLPFDHEWERAVRGHDHRLFPWGDEHLPLGMKVLDERYPRNLPVGTTRTPDGVEGAVSGYEEWCAGLWTEDGVDPRAWYQDPVPPWSRVQRGGGSSRWGKAIPSGVSREPSHPFTYDYDEETAIVRLVRGDGRSMVPPHPETPADELAMGECRRFESCVLRPVLDGLRDSRLAREHAITIQRTTTTVNDPGAVAISRAAKSGARNVRSGDFANWVTGLMLVAVSRETIRRIPPEHGVYVWQIQYRLFEDGTLRARPVVAFRMAFDRGLHRFENRFRPHEPHTELGSVTPDMIRQSILESFQFYEIHADSDVDPFKR